MAESHPTSQTNRDATSSRGGWTPSRGFWIGMGGVVAFALMLTAAGAIAAGRAPEPVAVSEAASTVAITSTTTESPVTAASSWSMDPVSDGTAASSTSMTPEQVTSSAMVAALDR